MIVFAIDPGNVHSAFAYIRDDASVIATDKVLNEDLLSFLQTGMFPEPPDAIAIEMIASYGMAVGQTVFDTCVWLGRFQQVLVERFPDVPVQLVYRQPIKLHHCHSNKATDANVIQALIDRFAYGVPNRGKGRKAAPGWFYGFAADMWQAYALAVYVLDQGKDG